MLFGAMNFPVTPLLKEIDTFTRMGFDYIEIAMDPPMGHYSILSSRKREILRSLRDSHLGLVCHLPTFVTTADLTESLRRASVNEMTKSLEVASELGAKKVVLHPSMVFGMGAFVIDTVKGYAYDFLSEMVSAAQRLDITICLENMMPRNILGVDPDDFEEIFTMFPSIKLTLDTGHANISDPGGCRLIKLVERFGNRIAHLHFSDNLGSRDDHLAVGEGTIDFPDLVNSLKTLRYDDTLTLEIFNTNRQALVNSRENIKMLLLGDCVE